MPSPEKLAEFVAWCQKHITGDEKGQAQIFLAATGSRTSFPSAHIFLLAPVLPQHAFWFPC